MKTDIPIIQQILIHLLEKPITPRDAMGLGLRTPLRKVVAKIRTRYGFDVRGERAPGTSTVGNTTYHIPDNCRALQSLHLELHQEGLL